MDTITIKNIHESIGRLLEGYHEKIWNAYLKSEKGITVSVPIKIRPDEKTGGATIDVSLRFVAERIDAGVLISLDRKQLALFEAFDNLRPKPGDEIESVSIGVEGEEPVVLRARGEQA